MQRGESPLDSPNIPSHIRPAGLRDCRVAWKKYGRNILTIRLTADNQNIVTFTFCVKFAGRSERLPYFQVPAICVSNGPVGPFYEEMTVPPREVYIALDCVECLNHTSVSAKRTGPGVSRCIHVPR